MKINVFIPHRWNNGDYNEIIKLLDCTKFNVRDYSIPKDSPLDSIDRRFTVDPTIQKKIRYASVVICSNRPANNSGIAIEEIKFAVSIGKPIVAIQVTDNTSAEIQNLKIPVISKRKDALETWIQSHTKRVM